MCGRGRGRFAHGRHGVAGWSSAGHQLLSYEGPFGVGYGVAVLHDALGAVPCSGGGPRTSVPTLAEIARESVAAALGKSPATMPTAAADSPPAHSGVFVTLHDRHGQLRGCIGTVDSAGGDIIEETWQLARAAAFRDARFPPVAADEFDGLGFEVSSLSEPEPAASAADLDPRVYGVIVSGRSGRRGVLLPDIPTIDTAEQQIAVARRKAGLAAHEPCTIQRFRVVRSRETPKE